MKKTFKDFIATKQLRKVEEFEKETQQDIESTTTHCWVYQDFYYILIHNYKSIGNDSSPTYQLIIENRFYESTSLIEMENMLYNDWFIPCVVGEGEWIKKYGYHNPHTTPLYVEMFEDMGFKVEDISYKNDLVDCLRLKLVTTLDFGQDIFEVMLPNSANFNDDEELFNTFIVRTFKDGDIDDSTMYENIFDCVDDLEFFMIQHLHQIARDFMKKMSDKYSIKDDSFKSFVVSLDEYLDTNKVIKHLEDDEILRGKVIIAYFDVFKHLSESMVFGCEPLNMFDDFTIENEEDVQEDYEDMKNNRDYYMKKYNELKEIVDSFTTKTKNK